MHEVDDALAAGLVRAGEALSERPLLRLGKGAGRLAQLARGRWRVRLCAVARYAGARFVKVQDQQSLAQASGLDHPAVEVRHGMYADSIHLPDADLQSASAGMTAIDSLENIVCNLCGREDVREIHEQPLRDPAVADAGDFAASTDRFDGYGRIVRCNHCALVYTNPRPRRDQISTAYASSADAEYTEEDSCRSINAHLCLHTLKRFVRSGRLLDVGASTGYFLNAARIDFDTVGVEPSRWAARYARERLRLEVLNAALGLST